MSIAEVIQSVRFVVDSSGKPTDALLSIEAWEALMEKLEDLEDARIVRAGIRRLDQVQNDPSGAGLLRWEEAEAQLGT